VIIVDYIQQVSVNGKRSKQEAIANYISDCKELSLAYNTVIILASQINRAGASITDGAAIDFMKGAGEIEEAADYLFHLRWIGKEEKDAPINKYQVNLIKNRFGPVQNFTLEFNSEYCRFGKPERKADEFPENKRHSPYGS